VRCLKLTVRSSFSSHRIALQRLGSNSIISSPTTVPKHQLPLRVFQSGKENFSSGYGLSHHQGNGNIFGSGAGDGVHGMPTRLNSNPLCFQPSEFHLNPFGGSISNSYRPDVVSSTFTPVNGMSQQEMFSHYLAIRRGREALNANTQGGDAFYENSV